MKVIAVASQKGGVGKTTLTGHLSVAAAKDGHSVCIIDSDPQGSLASWWNEREDQDINFVPASLDGLSVILQTLRESKVDIVFIDTPPSINKSINNVVELSDLVIVPTRASPHDLRALGGTMDIINEHNKKMFFVVNGAANRARVTTEAVIELSQHGPVCPSVIYQRTEFATSMIDGRTVLDLNNKSKSALEIAELWIYVNKQLHKKGNVK